MVVPMFKKGSRTNPFNYRPISLTCICCKIFEHIISSAIFKYTNFHNIICIEQQCRKHRSCKTQPLETINDLPMTLNSGIQTNLLLLDFSFDKVSHPRLLYKLQHYSINGSLSTYPLFNWIKDPVKQGIGGPL